MRPHHGAPGKYVPLVRSLEALPAHQQAVTLTFAQLEALVGLLAPLPRTTGGYWTSSPTARMNWQRAGFTASLDRLRSTVTFTRR